MELILDNISVEVENKVIIQDLSLTLNMSETTALMGLNGSGKTTLTNTIMGNPDYHLISGKILIKKDNQTIDISKRTPDERAKIGLFVTFQNPLEIEGVSLRNMLRLAYNSIHNTNISVSEFNKKLINIAQQLNTDTSFLQRPINEGFSGGEKKKSEMLQLLALEPKYAILDEIDSGLDIDSLKTIAKSINSIKNKTGFLIISHYKRIFQYIKPNRVLIILKGRFVKEGNSTL
ncbi:MAG: Fe-S cluster assembly ATPase SufC, partial [Nitrospiraceae bacterium]|nr:Fe-S cluster assembly ATPase SufC [Nitrospiraceae bacterium]